MKRLLARVKVLYKLSLAYVNFDNLLFTSRIKVN